MRSDGDGNRPFEHVHTEGYEDVGYLLFDSLAHHLIEKGVLTKNDALSIVQTAAEVVRGRIGGDEAQSLQAKAALAILERTYSSFEAVGDKRRAHTDGHNIRPLRPPLHGDTPQFPSDD